MQTLYAVPYIRLAAEPVDDVGEYSPTSARKLLKQYSPTSARKLLK
jgi:hypothetical protein